MYTVQCNLGLGLLMQTAGVWNDVVTLNAKQLCRCRYQHDSHNFEESHI